MISFIYEDLAPRGGIKDLDGGCASLAAGRRDLRLSPSVSLRLLLIGADLGTSVWPRCTKQQTQVRWLSALREWKRRCKCKYQW